MIVYSAMIIRFVPLLHIHFKSSSPYNRCLNKMAPVYRLYIYYEMRDGWICDIST